MAKRILLAGGYGVVGAQVATLLRKHHPETEILIGGRREKEAAALAASLGHAAAALMDVTRPEPMRGLDGIDAVGCFIHETDDHLLHEAAERGIPYMDITRGQEAQMRGLAAAALLSPAAPVLFTSHWMAGGPAIIARRLAEGLDSVTRIDMSILYYTGDKMGPDSASAGEGMARGFTARVAGAWQAVGPLSDDRMVRFPSGATRPVYRMNMGDVTTLALANGARDAGVRLGLDKGNSLRNMRRLIRLGLWEPLMRLPGMSAIAATKPGPGAPHEIVIEVEGEAGGRRISRRATILDPLGQSHLTAVGGLYGLERISALGPSPLGPGAALPETGFSMAGYERLASLYQAEGIELGLEGG
ncbi:hypothetical protein [Parvibaculum sp.]|uniref:hypothetical protein n=1 Tax=Parvibaculum sp. TaxID=2024848 RepID=UPI001B0F8693|nr:hypothetical protein [Parvibaculum sp.]MBO6668190.1 hypothetical protein [Parvibaculum sp.]MBO6691724.1 hypothetical protein [Parvibaculum sp.]MBO6714692.1 hypothetical protein [Parvibaculum sp.]